MAHYNGQNHVAKDQYEMHLVPHIHWDREWYRTFQDSRAKLVKTIDKLLLLLDSNPDYRYFVLDGQAVILEDYLEIHPEKEGLLKKCVSQRKLFVGPWYTLPDEFLVSGESIIRNLMLGHKIASRFGRVMKVGYVPDQFGHISQLPQILRGFDIDSAVFSRGLGDEGEKLGSEFIWRSPDGNEVLAVHQIGGYMSTSALGYENPDEFGISTDPLNPKKALESIHRIKIILAKYARTKYLLLNNGEDFFEPQPELPDIIKYLNDNIVNAKVIHSNFEELIKRIKDSHSKLDFFEGELRSAKYWFMLYSVLSTRMTIKKWNEQTQTKLEKIAEPLATLAWLEGLEYPKHHLWQAWKYLLQSHFHDSICGCGIDAVHRDVVHRFIRSLQISDEITSDSINYIGSRINTTFSNPGAIPIMVFNCLNWFRDDIANVNLSISDKEDISSNYFVLDKNGEKALANISISIESQKRKPREVKVSFLAEKIPPFGFKTYYLSPSNQEETSSSTLKGNKNIIENEYFQITANKNGTLKIIYKPSNFCFDGVLLFEDVEDVGDEYSFSPARFSRKITTKKCAAKITILDEGPVSLSLKIEILLKLPKEISINRTNRSDKFINCLLQSYVTLYSKVRRIDFRTIFNNCVKDHRLRVIFPTDIMTDCTYAESSFDVVRRPIEPPSATDWKESPSLTQPQQSYVSINDGAKGMTLINQGLPEYEAIRTEKGTSILLTLLRCVGWLSRDDLKTRKGRAGPRLYPDLRTPDAQCLGRHEFRYSLVIHEGGWKDNKVWRDAYNHNTPLILHPTSQHLGPLAQEFSFVQIKPESLIISAMKKGELRNSLILRIFNPESKQTEVEIYTHKKIMNAHFVNLYEKKNKDLGNRIDTLKNRIRFNINSSQIITLQIDF